MSLYQVIYSGFDSCNMLMLENNNHKRRKCHYFPGDKECKTILYYTDTYHRGMLQQECNAVQTEIILLLTIGFHVK